MLNFIDHPNSMKICFENDKKEKVTVLCSFYEFKVLGSFDNTDLVKYSDILSKLSMFQKKAITKSIASLISKKILIQVFQILNNSQDIIFLQIYLEAYLFVKFQGVARNQY